MAGDRSIKVTLRADVSDFKSQFDAASKAADQVAKSTEDAGSKSKGVFGQLKQSAQDNRQAWTTAGTALTGFGAAILGVGAMAARTGVAYNQLQQRAGSALEVLMGSAEAAAEQMAKLNEFADTSPFSREIFIEAQQQLIAFGVEAERVVPILSAVQDAVAATGGSNQDISELVDIIAKVGSTGKITAQTLNELGYRGVDAATIIGEQMGKTGQQIRDEITAGTLDADAAMQALTDGMSEKFGGAAAGMKETFDGAIDRLKAAWRDLSAELMAPLVSPDGGGFLVDLTNSAADALRAIQKLPEPIKLAGAALGGLTGAASLGAGAFMLLLPRALDTWDAFRRIGLVTDATAGKLGRYASTLGKVGLAAGVAAAAFPLLVKAGREIEDTFKGIHRDDYALGLNDITARVKNAASETGAYNAILGDLADTGAINTEQFDSLGYAVDSIANMDAFGRIGKSAGLLAGGMDLIIDRFEGVDDALVQMAGVDFGEAQESFKAFADEAMRTGATFEDVLSIFPGFKDELVGVAEAMGLDGTDSAVLYRIAMEGIGPAAEGAQGGMEGLEGASEDVADALDKATDASNKALDGLLDLGNAFLDARDAARQYEDALKDANDAAEENGKHWEDGTDAARENAEAIDGLSDAILTNADKMRSNGEASGEWLSGQREDLIDVAMQMGATRDEAEKYVDQLGLTPETIETQIELDTEQAQAKWDEIYREIWPEGGHPPMAIGADTAPAEETVGAWTGLLSDQPPTDVQVGANVEPGMTELYNLENTIAVSGGTVTINGDATPGDQVLDTLMGIINSSDGTVTINGKTYPADEALSATIEAINHGGGTVTIEGNPLPAFGATDEAKSKADNTTGTIDVDGNRSPADGKIDGVKSKADRTTGNVTVNASTGGAESAINRLIRPRRMTINVGYSDPGFKGSGGGSRFASGGPVFGPGTETSDSIHAMLSHNEHVFAAREVKAAGGHAGVYRIREQLLAGAKTIHLNTGGAADGSVGAVQYAPAYQQSRPQPVSAPVDTGAITSAVAAGARQGIEAANITAMVTDRVAAGLHQRGKSASRAFGGGR